MAQNPPFNPPPPPPGFGPPPPGYGPPPPGFGAPGPGYPYPQAPRTSGAAVVSLVCGIVCCIPFVTSVIAIITGIVGIRSTSNPFVRGRGMALAGLILGILGLLFQLSGGIGAGIWWVASTPERLVANQFINNLTQGNLDAAAGQCTSNVTRDHLQSFADALTSTGTVQQSMFFFAMNDRATGGKIIQGQITFTNAQQYQVFLTMDNDNGTWKIRDFRTFPPIASTTTAPSPQAVPSTQQ